MERRITGFHQDEDGVWVAELACGHHRHVRHEPPFQLRPWVVGAETRQERVGEKIDCLLCAQGARASVGGEPACLLLEVCPNCGVVLGDGLHRPGCTAEASS